MSTRRRLFTLFAVIAILAIGGRGLASTPAAGTARTQISVLSLDGNLAGLAQLIELAVGAGLATTDPARNALSHNSAMVQLAAAGASGAVPVDSAPYLFEAKAECAGCETPTAQSGAAEARAVDVAGVVTGTAEVGARMAEAGPAHAAAGMLGVKLNFSALGGLVLLEGVAAELADTSDALRSRSSQSVTIERVSIFAIQDLLEQLGRTLDDLSLEGLIALADSILPAGTTDDLKDALADFEAAEEDEAILEQALEDLADGDVTNDADALLAIAELGLKYLGDPTALPSAIGTAIALVKAAAEALIDELRALLEDTIGPLALVTLEGVVAGVIAEATGSAATAVAGVTWPGAKVAGVPVPELATVGDTLALLTDLVESVIDLLAEALGIEISVALSAAEATRSTSTDGPYQVAAAGVKGFALEVSIETPAVGPSAYAVDGQTVTVAAEVLSVSARAEHRPGTAGTTGAPGPDDPLATTGLPGLIPIAGLILVVLGTLVRWLLGAKPRD